jgi:hypothetical protein
MHNSSTFTETEINARNVGDLRDLLGVSKDTTINVNGTRCEDDSMEIPESTDDGHAYIAIVPRDKTGGTKIGRPKTTKATKARKAKAKGRPRIQSTKVTKAYRNLGEMGEDVRTVMKSFVNKDGKYDTREGAVISSLYGQELKRIKVELDIYNADNQQNRDSASGCLELTT